MAKDQPFRFEATYAPISKRSCSRSSKKVQRPQPLHHHTYQLFLCSLWGHGLGCLNMLRRTFRNSRITIDDRALGLIIQR